MSALFIFLLLILYINYISHAYNQDINYAIKFFENDTDRFKTDPYELLSFGNERMHNFTENKSGIMFSGVFTNNTVLQRQPQYAAIYGTCDTFNTTIILSIQNEYNQTIKNHSTTSMSNGDWKISFPQTYPNGGNYTLIIYCTECMTKPKKSTIYNITFGDIYLCSGQSNMNLEVDFTFNAQYTYNNITELNKYSNIRVYTKRPYGMSDNISSFVIPSETDINNGKYEWQPTNIDNIERVKLFSATCWYTAQSLIDKYNMSDINFGLILSAVDGSQIEAWIMNNSINGVCDETKCDCPGTNCGTLYNGMIVPFINMSLKAILWYQGENNIHQQEIDNAHTVYSSYSCLQKLMINQYRTHWNNSYLPFGIVQIAAGCSEGHRKQMPYFRHSQTGKYGILPNQEMLNVFMAQAYDIGDPWYRYAEPRNLYPAPYDWNTTKWFMGSIHPRAKLYVGGRMAMNINKFVYHNDEIWNGPLIKSCKLDVSKAIITVNFHNNMLYDEDIIIQALDLWYNESLVETIKYWSAIKLLFNEKWIDLDGMNVLTVGDNGHSIIVNISNIVNKLNSATDMVDITGISYAWSDYPCCGDLDRKQHPCPMNMCPIITSKSRLPAIPFQARIVHGKCQCYAPQKCDGSDYVLPGMYIDSVASTTMNVVYSTEISTMMSTVNIELPIFICVLITRTVTDSNINDAAGQYERIYGDLSYWTRMNADQNKNIFYDNLSGFWHIGSMEDMEHSLVCEVQNVDSPVDCDKWIDYNSNEMDDMVLNEGKCIDIDIKTLDVENEDKSYNILDDKIKVTLFTILGECLCIFMLGIYCKRKSVQSRSRYEQEQLQDLTSDQNNDIHIQQLDPMDIDQALDPALH